METKEKSSTPLHDPFSEQDQGEAMTEANGKTKFTDTTESSSSSSSSSSVDDMDGGYGWVIVIASFFNAFIIDGIGSSFGLLFPFVVEKFGTTAFVASFAGSLFVALLIMGSISVELVKRFGFRAVCIVGGILSCLSLTASAFSPNITIFVLTYGLLAGCSCGLVFLPSIVLVNSYFHQKRGLANGIITSGSGAGLLVLAPLINFLLSKYSLDGTILIMAGILLNMCVFSSFYRTPLLDQCEESLLEIEDGVICSQETEKGINSFKFDSTKSMDFTSEGIDSDMNPRKMQEINNSSSHRRLWLTSNGKSENGSLRTVVNQNHPGKSIFRSEYQLDTRENANGFHIPLLHSSVHNIPTWCQDKGQNHIPHNSMMKNSFDRHRHYHQSHHHSQEHHKLHPHGHFSFDQGSHLYLAGSISTLKNLHHKHLIQDILSSLPPASEKILHTSVPELETNVQSFPADEAVSVFNKSPLGHQVTKEENHTACVPSVQIQSFINSQPNQDIDIKSLVNSDYTSVTSMDVDKYSVADVTLPIPLPPSGFSIGQLLCMPTFYLFATGASLIQLGYPIAGTFLADHAYQYGLTSYHTAVLMGLLGGLNICGRLLSGVLANLRIDPLHLHNVTLMLGGITCLLCPLYTEFWSLCVLASLFGLFLGFFPPLQPLIIVEFFGMGSLASAFGFLTTVKGVASMLGAPVAGWIYDASGDYSMSFIFAGIVFICSAVVHAFMPVCRKWKKTKGVNLVTQVVE